MFTHLPSLNNVKTFAVAAHYLSFKDAARALNITPTAVSHQIKSLESQLRVQLFERKTRAVQLTRQGEALAKVCIDSLNRLDNAFIEFMEPKNDLLISCCNSFAALWLAPNMAAINRAFPNQTVTICASDQLIDLDKEKHIDIALRYGNAESNSNEIHLIKEQIGMYASPNYQPPRQGKPVLFITHWRDESGLKNIPCHEHIDESLYELRYFEQEHFVMQAAVAGQGMALMSDVLARTAVTQGWLYKQTEFKAFEGYSYWVRQTTHRKSTLIMERFTAWLAEALVEEITK
ncbi:MULTISPECIES: LysR family transcriptional regulator [Pseudoalteromonas]|uniref:LysR family transcriptional regulator n=1 Tax=Pseudoalteromonas TaxID=53246 RepID=UPI000FFF1518|nr:MULTISPECIES: LysR family transcriptional regulator [Pseudoalteromonas]MCG9759096.1 LysR family transcriptional regulator [Pseudoalteromonas sp. Isolate6]NKC18991.1 LysR family transcriptional regulator [Pseudoalteromonas galatheae]RXE87385.1 LysR family transcriptional regulator [Pseudoalteromonas sp. A757]